MTTTTTDISLNDLDEIIDADFHLKEQLSDFVAYLEGPYAKTLKTREPGDHFGGFYPSSGYFNASKQTGKVPNRPVRSSEGAVEGMDVVDVDKIVLTPTLNLLLGCVHHDELAAALASAYNDWLLDEFLSDQTDMFGTAVIAPQKPREAAAEIDDRASESGIVGIMMPSGGASPLLGHERYHPIYEACERADLPILMHNAGTCALQSFPTQVKGSSRYTTLHAAYHPSEHMFQLASILTNGVPVRFPDLRIVFQEAGIGWIPYFMRRYDNEYSARRIDAPMLEEDPSTYIRENMYFTSQPVEGIDDPEYLANTIHAFGGGQNLMFSTDYPHFDFDQADTLFRSIRSRLGKEEVQNIFYRTARTVFDI